MINPFEPVPSVLLRFTSIGNICLVRERRDELSRFCRGNVESHFQLVNMMYYVIW